MSSTVAAIPSCPHYFAHLPVDWANSDDFLAFSASEHDDVLASVVEVFKGFPKVYHINFKLDVTVPLDMPVTEIVVITSVSPEAKQKLCDTLAEVCEYLKGVMTYGTPEQAGDKDVVVVVCGWNSLEVSDLHGLVAKLPVTDPRITAGPCQIVSKTRRSGADEDVGTAGLESGKTCQIDKAANPSPMINIWPQFALYTTGWKRNTYSSLEFGHRMEYQMDTMGHGKGRRSASTRLTIRV